ncbi:hypothetical protein ACRZ5S_08140 [Vibrio scophthalmi]|uniref:hypothetical protein n=1 Tax=Vibrio scophthalmi TaxID=45658 RepID=UPI003EBDCAF9
MNPNFQKQQLTDEFIQAMRANSSRASWTAYQKKRFDDVDKTATKKWYAELSMIHCLPYFRQGVGITVFLSTYAFLSFLTGTFLSISDSESLLAIFFSILSGVGFWFAVPEICNHYKIGPIAFSAHQHQNLSEQYFAAVRKIAWFGVVFCIVITFWVGPMAFVGAGASALIAFKLVDAKRQDIYTTIPYDSVLCLDVIKKMDYVAIWYKGNDVSTEPESPEIYENIMGYEIYCQPEQFDDILATLKSKLHPKVQIVESESLDDSINFFEESKKYDISLISVPLHEEPQQKTEFDSTEDAW